VPERHDVAIVGGGIAGLALAAGLADTGLDICLLEARPLAPRPLPAAGLAGYDARVSALTPRSIAQLDRLGAWQRILARRSCSYRHMTVWDADGTGRIDFDADEMGTDSLGTIVENSVITQALLEELLEQKPQVRLLAGEALSGAGRETNGDIILKTDSGEVSAGLVVAADGALSPLRQWFGFRTREWNYGHRAIVTTVVTERSHADTAWQRFLTTGPLALLPLPDCAGEHFCSIVWSIDDAEADDLLALGDGDFCAALTRASESVLGEIRAAAPRFAFPLRQRHAVDYVQPGVALVGDAAHTIHPLAGQGINLGLHDVEVLAGEIAGAAARGLDPGDLQVLRRYQRQRKGDNLLMMAAMDGFKRLFGTRSLPLRLLRNTGLKGASALTPVKHQIMRHAMGLGD
jgi:2-octaprenylphenol hydroxylase